ncbi:hypothetical protein [Paraburkholderia youngii]|uniref:hypothetical protein n=1 Tax=Paraburkholderia youngii TaxID=2782701 RepID=UPI00359FD3DB
MKMILGRLTLVAGLMLGMSHAANAVLPVIDASNLAQNIITAAKAVKTEIYQDSNIVYQYQMMANQLLQATNLDPSAMKAQYDQITGDISKFTQLKSTLTDMYGDLNEGSQWINHVQTLISRSGKSNDQWFDAEAPAEGLRDVGAEQWNRYRHPGRLSTYAQTTAGERVVYFEQSDHLDVDAERACEFVTCSFDYLVRTRAGPRRNRIGTFLAQRNDPDTACREVPAISGDGGARAVFRAPRRASEPDAGGDGSVPDQQCGKGSAAARSLLDGRVSGPSHPCGVRPRKGLLRASIWSSLSTLKQLNPACRFASATLMWTKACSSVSVSRTAAADSHTTRSMKATRAWSPLLPSGIPKPVASASLKRRTSRRSISRWTARDLPQCGSFNRKADSAASLAYIRGRWSNSWNSPRFPGRRGSLSPIYASDGCHGSRPSS